MYVCGTNAFDPACDYMVRRPALPCLCALYVHVAVDKQQATAVCLSVQSYENGRLTLEKKEEDGKGKCPFDPFQRYASIMLGKIWGWKDD